MIAVIKKLFSLLFSAIMVMAGCKVQNVTGTKSINDNSELKKLVLIDQEMRKNDTLDMEPIDKKHRAVVMSFLANGLVKTTTDKFNAALILQHTALTFCNGKLVSISPENYLLAHHLSKSAFEAGDKSIAYMTAVTFDRYLLYTEGYQKYGTQRVNEETT